MTFWQAYPRKVARTEAWKAWKQMNAEAIADQVMEAIARQTEADFQYRPEDKVPHGASWLRAERWNDVVRPRVAVPEKVQQSRSAVAAWLDERKAAGK